MPYNANVEQNLFVISYKTVDIQVNQGKTTNWEHRKCRENS